MDNNAYFEQKEQFFGTLSDDAIRDSLGRAQVIVDELERSEAWQNVLSDANAWCEKLDNEWQGIYDEEKLKKMRVLKNSYAFIRALPAVYKRELEISRKELERRDVQQTTIEKDYDNESNYGD